MNKEFIPYEQALELKELGFDDYNIAWYAIVDEKPKIVFLNYGSHLCAPLYQQAFRWFREKEYYSDITTECTQVDSSVGFSWWIWKPWSRSIEERSPEKRGDEWSYKTYEEAELECLKKLIEIVKNK